jgi:hypothetical protein
MLLTDVLICKKLNITEIEKDRNIMKKTYYENKIININRTYFTHRM